LGFVGWNQFIEQSKFWLKHKKLLRGTWIWFWIINTILLLVLTFTYTKRTMVEPLSYLSEKQDLNAVVFEYPGDSMPWFPRFYLEKEVPVYRFFKGSKDEKIKSQISSGEQGIPKYYYFYGNDDLEDRVKRLENFLSINLELEKKINPSNIDWIVHTLNPKHNKNHTGYIYRLVYN